MTNKETKIKKVMGDSNKQIETYEKILKELNSDQDIINQIKQQ